MKNERFKIIASVFLLLVQDGKVLLSRRFQTGFADGQYSVVAGHIDGDESLRAAMAREAKEEAGVDIAVDDLQHVLTQHVHFSDHERLFVYFNTVKWVGDIRNMEPEKCDDLQWFSVDALPSNTIPYIRQAIEAYQAGDTYAELGWNT